MKKGGFFVQAGLAALLLSLSLDMPEAAGRTILAAPGESGLETVEIDLTGIEYRKQDYSTPQASRLRSTIQPLGGSGPFSVNDTRNFLITTGETTEQVVSGKLLAQGSHTNIWLIDDGDFHAKTGTIHNGNCMLDRITTDMANALASDFDGIYSAMTDEQTGFAPHSGVIISPGYSNLPVAGDLGGDGKMNFVLYDIFGDGAAQSGGVMGFFYSNDLKTYDGSRPMNNLDMLHIDIGKLQGYSRMTGNESAKLGFYNVLTHEFQHMLFYMYFGIYTPDYRPYSWIDESLSELAGAYYTKTGYELFDSQRMWSASSNDYDGSGSNYSDFVNFLGGGNLKNYGMGNMLSLLLYKQNPLYPHGIYSYFQTAYPRAVNGAAHQQNTAALTGKTMDNVWGNVWNFALDLSAPSGADAFRQVYFDFMENFAADGGRIHGEENTETTKFSLGFTTVNNLWWWRYYAGNTEVTGSLSSYFQRLNAIPLLNSNARVTLYGSGTNTTGKGATQEKFYRLTSPDGENPWLKITIPQTAGTGDRYYVVIPRDLPPDGAGVDGADIYPLTEGEEVFIHTEEKQAYLFAATLYQNVNSIVTYEFTDREIENTSVDSVAVTPETAVVVRGGTKQFTATVSGSNNPPQDVSWTVVSETGGSVIGNTEIDSSGLLTVNENEAAGTELIVTATSVADEEVYGRAVVTVIDASNGDGAAGDGGSAGQSGSSGENNFPNGGNSSGGTNLSGGNSSSGGNNSSGGGNSSGGTNPSGGNGSSGGGSSATGGGSHSSGGSGGGTKSASSKTPNAAVAASPVSKINGCTSYTEGTHGTWSYDSAENAWFFIQINGESLKSQWAEIGKNVYRFGTDGKMASGWFKDLSGKWYYFNEAHDGFFGRMVTGWFYDNRDGKWYYLNPTDGAMSIGWIQTNEKWYYLNPAYDQTTKRPLGSMFQDELTPDGYRVDKNGACI